MGRRREQHGNRERSPGSGPGGIKYSRRPPAPSRGLAHRQRGNVCGWPGGRGSGAASASAERVPDDEAALD